MKSPLSYRSDWNPSPMMLAGFCIPSLIYQYLGSMFERFNIPAHWVGPHEDCESVLDPSQIVLGCMIHVSHRIWHGVRHLGGMFCFGFGFGSFTNGLGCTIFHWIWHIDHRKVPDRTLDPSQMVWDVYDFCVGFELDPTHMIWDVLFLCRIWIWIRHDKRFGMYYSCVGFDFGSDTNGWGCIIFVSDLILDPTQMVSIIFVSDLTLDPTQMVWDGLSLCRIWLWIRHKCFEMYYFCVGSDLGSDTHG